MKYNPKGIYQKAKTVGLAVLLGGVVISSSGCFTGMKYARAEKQLDNVAYKLSKEPANENEAKLQEKLKEKAERTMYAAEKSDEWDNLTEEQKEKYRQFKQKVVQLEDFVGELNQQGGKK